MPFAPVPASSTTSLASSKASCPNVAESGTANPGTSPRTPRARRTRSSRAPVSSSPRVAISARAASTPARIVPDDDVVAVASVARSSRSASKNRVRATTTAPWFNAGRVLWALVTTASAPAANGCGGRSGWLPRWAPHAASTTRGTPAARVTSLIAPMSAQVPTYDGLVTKTARASGCQRRASATDAAGSPSGNPVVSWTGGCTHTGRSPASTSPSRTERCEVRSTITESPGRPTASRRAWLPWVEPPTEYRHQSAPSRSAARASAARSSVSASRMGASPPYMGMSPTIRSPTRSVRCLCPGIVNGRSSPDASRRRASTHARSSGASSSHSGSTPGCSHEPRTRHAAQARDIQRTFRVLAEVFETIV